MKTNAATRPVEGSGQTRGCRKPESLAPALPSFSAWASGLFAAELVRPGPTCPITQGGRVPEERKIDFFPAAQQRPFQIAVRGGLPKSWLPVRASLCLKTTDSFTAVMRWALTVSA